MSILFSLAPLVSGYTTASNFIGPLAPWGCVTTKSLFLYIGQVQVEFQRKKLCQEQRVKVKRKNLEHRPVQSR